MIKIEKEVTVTISGEDVETFRDVCNCGRIYLLNQNYKAFFPTVTGEYYPEKALAISDFINKVFNGV